MISPALDKRTTAGPTGRSAIPARRATSGARLGCISRRVAGMAAPTARLLALPATGGWLVWPGHVELVGRRMVLGRGAPGDRRLLPAAEPWSSELAPRRRVVAFAAHPLRGLSACPPWPRLVAVRQGRARE